MSYYRLKMLDFDGQYEYSKVVSVERKTGEFGVVSVFPTPTDGKVTVQVQLPEPAILKISVTDIQGRHLRVAEMEVYKGLNDVEVDLSNFAAGTYFIKVDNGLQVLTERIMKQ